MMRFSWRVLPLLAALVVGAGRIGLAADLINVAPLGTATQSSQLGAYSPDLAIDGDLGNFTHTQSGANLPATWELDLTQTYAIQEIVLHNRTSCCGSRLRDITVFILDETAQPVWQSDLLNPENELGTFPLGPAELSLDLVAIEGAVDGRFVRVTREPDPDLSGGGDGTNPDEVDVLSLGEVEVLVDAASVQVAISQQPLGGRAYVGRCHVFTVALFGAEKVTTLAYQWLKDDLPIRDATEDRLVLGPLDAEDSGSYKVRITADAEVLESEPADLVVVGPNLALHGIATQSSTDAGGPPERAIDGNVSGIYDEGSVTHTLNAPGAWWAVELFGDTTVDRVILWNRTDDCCRMRLTSFRVSALDSGGTVVWEGELPDVRLKTTL